MLVPYNSRERQGRAPTAKSRECLEKEPIIMALFTIAKTWKQTKCPPTDKWIKKLWYIYTMEYYSAIKRNTSESIQVRWMNLQPIIQSEVSQKKKNKCCISANIYGI